jgi:hypothetical protein
VFPGVFNGRHDRPFRDGPCQHGVAHSGECLWIENDRGPVRAVADTMLAGAVGDDQLFTSESTMHVSVWARASG